MPNLLLGHSVCGGVHVSTPGCTWTRERMILAMEVSTTLGGGVVYSPPSPSSSRLPLPGESFVCFDVFESSAVEIFVVWVSSTGGLGHCCGFEAAILVCSVFRSSFDIFSFPFFEGSLSFWNVLILTTLGCMPNERDVLNVVAWFVCHSA
jgi:hypothetical protein